MNSRSVNRQPDSSASPADPVVLLLGPTASGKSAGALALAQRFPIEIISVDSACVYRGMDVGTAKPSATERQQVRHHLIDCADPWEPYSAARFVDDARRLIHEIRQRGHEPLLVGGTMLYARALMQGLDDLPAADPAIRTRLEAEAADLGWPVLHARLKQIDPATAARLAPNDAQRIQRALEIHELTGQPMSTLLGGLPRAASADQWRVISLEPGDRSVLHVRIARRFRQMLEAGLIEEVERLRADPRIHAALASMKSVGYRQVWDLLEGRIGRDELPERAIAATRQLAKRQLTWLRSMTARTIIDCTASDSSVAGTEFDPASAVTLAGAAGAADLAAGQTATSDSGRLAAALVDCYALVRK